MNNPVGKIFSNLVVNADEILDNTRGMHKRNFRNQRRNQSSLGKSINSGFYEGSELSKLKNLEGIASDSASVSKDYIKGFDNIKNTKDLDIRGHRKSQRDAIRSSLDSSYNPDSFRSKASNVGSNIKDYYIGDGVSKEKRMARMGVTGIGSAVGLGVGARFLSGGNITQNSKGERDIMGIPFI